MPDYIIVRPFGDSDLANATIHLRGAVPQVIGSLAHGEYEIVAATSDGAPVKVTWVAPTASGRLPAQSFAEKSGVQTCDAAADFAGRDLAFDLVAPPKGVTVDSVQGTVSVDTGATGPLSGATVTVRATNSGGAATTGFALDVVAAVIPVPAATQAPAISGGGKVGAAQIGVDARWDATSAEVESRWTLDGSATGDTDASYLPVAGDDGRVLAFEQRARLAGGTWSDWVASRTVTVSHAAPTAAGGLADQTLTAGTGMAPLDVARDFTGQALGYALAPSSAPLPAGLSLSPAGVLSGTPAAASARLAIVVRATNSGGFADSGFGLTVQAAAQPGGFQRPTYSSTPSLAEVERLYTDRRLTRPDWWVNGTAPKTIANNLAELTAQGATYNAGSDLLTVPSGVTVASIVGWDLGYTRILCQGRIREFGHNRMEVPPYPKSERAAYNGGNRLPCIDIRWTGGQHRIDHFHHNWIVGCGAFGPTALIQGGSQNLPGTNHPKIDLFEWNSIEAYGADGVKTTWSGVRRFNYFDPCVNTPADAEAWQAGKTYVAGDVVWGGTFYYRICTAAGGTTTSPDFSAKLGAQPTGWKLMDPHSDTDTPFSTPPGELAEFYGNYYNRDMKRRRYPARQHHKSAVNALRVLPNNDASQKIGNVAIRYNVFSQDVEQYTSNPAIQLPPNSGIHAGATQVVENNWHEHTLTAGGNTGSTVQNNVAGWTPPPPATLSAVTASLSGGRLTYGFTADRHGWMTVVAYATAATRSAAQIAADALAGAGGAVLGVFEIEADPTVARQGGIGLSLAQGQTVHVHGLFQSGGGNDTVAPPQAVSAPSLAGGGKLTLKDFSRDRTLFDVGAAAGLAGADVRLSGTATAGQAVEARWVPEKGTPSAWRTIATATASGAWSGTLTVPQSPEWMKPEVRLAAAPGTTATTTNRFGTGHLIALWQQSEDARMCDSYFSLTRSDPIADPEAVQMFWHDRKGAGAAGVQHLHVSDASVANRASLAAMAAALIAAAPGHKFAILHHTQPGTDPREVANDSNTSRNWADEAALHNHATADGTAVGLASHSWFAAPGSLHDHYADALVPFYLGVRLDGSRVATPTTFSYGGGAGSYRMDHNLAEFYAMPARTKWLANQGAHRFDPVETLTNSTTVASDGSPQHSLRNKARATRSWRSALGNPALAAYFTAPVPAILCYETGIAAGNDWTDISHPSGAVDDGLPRRARYWALNWLRGLGLAGWALPTFDRCYREPSGAYVAVGSSAGPITTTRRARKLPALGKTFPHWTGVVGFEINGVPAQRAEIQPNGWVHVYPNSGNLTGATLTFGEGGATGMLRKPEDHVARLWMDYPIVDVGQGIVEGLPVQPLTDPAVLSGNSGPPSVAGDTTAPVLSNPTDAAAGATGYAGSVDTSEATGTLYWVVTASTSAPSAAQVRAGQTGAGLPALHSGAQPVTAAGTRSVAGSGLLPGVACCLHFMQEDAAGNRSAVVSGRGFTTATLVDLVAPTLSNPKDDATGATTASGSVDTSEATGTLHAVAIGATGATPTAAQVEAGQDAAGAPVPAASQAVTAAGTRTLTLTGLAAATAYRLAFMHKDAAGNRSAVALGDGFTTAVAATAAGSFTTGAGGCYFADPANLGPNAGVLTFEMRARNPAAAGTLFYQSGTRINIDMVSNGSVRISGIRDSAGVTLLARASSAANAFPADGNAHTIVASIDLPNRIARLWVDGALVVTATLAANTGQLDPNRFLLFLATHTGSSQFQGSLEHLKVWKAATSTGATAGLGTPHKAIAGNAAAVNADPWKQGADAT